MKSPRELPSGQTIGFAKMHGLGNDYVYVDGAQHHVNDPPALARWVSDRHVGIGSDGLIMVDPVTQASTLMCACVCTTLTAAKA